MLSSGFSLMGENPSVFTLQYMLYSEKVPMTSAGFSVFERDVPFIQMVLHGRVDYTSGYWNDTANAQFSRLKAIETGSGVSYRFADNVTREATETHNSFLFNVDFELRKETALAHYNYVSNALRGLNNQIITEHRHLSDTLVKVSYENSQVIYINYGCEPVQTGGLTIPAMDYVRVQGGN
jgi:hypothetical protein